MRVLPEFPSFCEITPEHRDAIEAAQRNMPPYSDFSFTSLWAWDTGGRRISTLHGNLLVRMTDYTTGAPFYSFVGTGKPTETALALLAHADAESISPALHLIPEPTAKLIDSSLAIVETRDHFDYVYSIPELTALAGSRYRNVRQHMSRFTRANPDAHIRMSASPHADILRVLEQRNDTSAEEYAALNRAVIVPLSVTVVVNSNGVQAFSIDEIVSSQWAVGHFWKAAPGYPGIYEFMSAQIAARLHKQNVALWNWEQDLGLSNLRFNKSKFQPVEMLKKYSVYKSGDR